MKKSDLETKKEHMYFTENGNLICSKDGRKTLIANFILRILKQVVLVDEGDKKGRQLEILFKSKDKEIPFIVSSDEFSPGSFGKTILGVGGSSAILYGSMKSLIIGTQELSGKVPEEINQVRGLTLEGNYLSEGMIISQKGIENSKDINVFATRGDFSRHLGFLRPDTKEVSEIASHLLKDFLELKDHCVTYPLIAHISLAPFTSVISNFLTTEKVALHFQGPSGGGKTFLARHASLFFGQFEERIPSWTSTPNFLEAEGYWFRDALFVIDDYKQGFVPIETIIRILQNYSGEHGRGRLTSNSKIQNPLFIRGMLLSTGEDFVTDVESITGRTICIKVEPEKNIQAGEQCKKHSASYRMFTLGLIHSVILDPDWKNKAKHFVNQKTDFFYKETQALSNGLRMASNWSLNALGFHFFLNYLIKLV